MTIPPRVKSIIDDVARDWSVTADDLLGPSMLRKFTGPRHEAMAWIRATIEIDGAPASFPQIGKWFDVHHTTVMHACRKYPNIGILSLAVAA